MSDRRVEKRGSQHPSHKPYQTRSKMAPQEAASSGQERALPLTPVRNSRTTPPLEHATIHTPALPPHAYKACSYILQLLGLGR